MAVTTIIIYPRLSVETERVPYDMKTKKFMKIIGGYYRQMFSTEYTVIDTKYDDNYILVMVDGNLQDDKEDIEQWLEQCNFIRINDKIVTITGRMIEFTIINL